MTKPPRHSNGKFKKKSIFEKPEIMLHIFSYIFLIMFCVAGFNAFFEQVEYNKTTISNFEKEAIERGYAIQTQGKFLWIEIKRAKLIENSK